jgi:hypothetical protein
MDRVSIIKDCYQCRYGNEECDCGYNSHCHETERRIFDMSVIPDWCPLPTVDEFKKEKNK